MFESDQTAASLAFVAFGANFLGTALLLLFNPHSRAVRWYTLFALSQLAWLLLQGLLLNGGIDGAWWRAYGITVHFLPALFFAAVLVQRYHTRWLHLLPIAVGLIVLPLMADPLRSPLWPWWQALAWGTPAVLYRGRRPDWDARTDRRLRIILSTIIPVAVLASILSGGGFVLFGLPLLTIGIQLLIFTGVVYHRYYDIEVRAARTGELAAAAAEQDRLALLGELSATIAHEVRNPLTGMRSLTQMIGEQPLDEEKRRRYADVILGEIGRLDRIVGNLTDLAKRTASTNGAAAADIALQTLFDDLMMLVEPRARRAGITLESSAADASVRTYRDALAQVLLNLLLNAVAHSPAGGTIRLAATRTPAHVAIAVSDQGPGVPADRRRRIFEPFETGGGTGLGLAVVRRITDERGWTIDVGDAEGGGARFTLTLPAA